MDHMGAGVGDGRDLQCLKLRGEVHQDHAGDRPHPGIRRGPCEGGEPGPGAHELGVYPALLRRPDMLVEPGHQRQVVRQSP